MTKDIIKVDGMSCEHCVKAVSGAAGALPGVADVAVDLDGGIVTIDYDTSLCSLEALKEVIEDQGYDVIE